MRSSSDAGVDVGLEQSEGGGDLALVAGGDRSLDVGGRRRRVERVGVDGEHRQRLAAGGEPGDQVDDAAVRPQPAAEHDAGDARHRRRVPGQRSRDDDVGAVARRDQHGALLEVVEQVGHRHRRHLDVTDLASEVVGVPGRHLRGEGVAELGQRGVAQGVVLGQRPHGDRGHRLAGEAADELAVPLRRDAVDDQGDQAVALPDQRLLTHPNRLEDVVDAAVVAVDDGDDGRAEVARHAGVEAELEVRRRAGEVGALDDDEVARLLQLLVDGDGLGHAGVGLVAAGAEQRAEVLGDEGVPDALVGEAVAGADQLEVVVGERLHDRAEEPDPAHPL